MGGGALRLLDDIEAHKGDLHGHDGAEDVEGGVGDVEAVGEAGWVGGWVGGWVDGGDQGGWNEVL